jgi:Aromatic prenyltransferase Orf2
VSATEEIYSAIEKSCGVLDIACSRDKVWPVLDAYKDALKEGVIVFSVASGRHGRQLDYSISVPPAVGDPYAIAVSNGFSAETDHPVGALLSDISDRCPIGLYAIDGEVNGGFKKTYQFFPPDDLQRLAKLADIPSMPPGVAEYADLFARYGLDKIQMTSIDYQQRAVNLYFSNLPAESTEPETIRSMLREMELPEPSEEGLRLARRSFSIYPTISWDSSRIERMCFAVITTDPTRTPASAGPEMVRWARNAPYAHVGDRTLVYGLTVTPDEEYYKLGSYYRVSDVQRKLLKAFDALKSEV